MLFHYLLIAAPVGFNHKYIKYNTTYQSDAEVLICLYVNSDLTDYISERPLSC